MKISRLTSFLTKKIEEDEIKIKDAVYRQKEE
jgi:hypothetical protein